MSMSAGVAGARRRWDLDLANDTDVNLATELASAPTHRPLAVKIPSGVTAGGVSDEALSAGDLSTFVSVNCLIYGNAHGKGGAASGGNAGHAIDGNNQSNLSINVQTGGELRGGGGGGGQGGLGGIGNSYGSWGSYYWVYVDGQGESQNGEFYYTGTSQASIYSGSSVGSGNGASYLVNRVYNGNAYIFQKGIKDGPPEFSFYHIRAARYYGGAAGAGGAGGQGQGYNQSAESGAGGAAGTNRAGTGGTGAVGAVWATAGAAGGVGDTGLYSTVNTLSAVSAGGAGGAGGAAGDAVINFTGVTINNNGGTISGDYT